MCRGGRLKLGQRGPVSCGTRCTNSAHRVSVERNNLTPPNSERLPLSCCCASCRPGNGGGGRGGRGGARCPSPWARPTDGVAGPARLHSGGQEGRASRRGGSCGEWQIQVGRSVGSGGGRIDLYQVCISQQDFAIVRSLDDIAAHCSTISCKSSPNTA